MDPILEQRLKDLNEAFLIENAKLNLSAFRTPEQSWAGNILDSIAFIDIIKRLFPTDPGSLRIADIGTGGGFPLLPLALAFPTWSFTGIDATKKKLDAIERIMAALHITNITLVCGRAEELGHDPQFREQFDIVTARALASLSTLMEYTAPFCRQGGKCIYWKSMHIADEQRLSLNAMQELTLSVHSTQAYTLPDDWGTRQLLVYDKVGILTDQYPRRTGTPQKEPL